MTDVAIPTGPAYVDLAAYHGDTFEFSIVVTASTSVDITGHTPLLQIRDSNDALIKDWSAYVTIASATQINVAVPIAGWSGVPRPRGGRIFNYDLQLTSSTPKTRTILRGKLMVTGDVSHG